MTDADGKLLGNNGDVLMHRVFHHLLEELEISPADAAAGADIAVVPPSGALLESYSFPRLLTQRLAGFENHPLVIFPSSALFPTQDPAELFQGRRAETILLLREALSYDHLQALWGGSLSDAGVALVLDHDVVASGHNYVPGIIGSHRGSGGGLLLAARRDREQNAASLQAVAGTRRASLRLRGRLASAIPYGRARTWLTRRARRAVNDAAANDLLQTVPSSVLETHVGPTPRTIVRIDASATQFATFDEYRTLVANADAVLTNRLHVGLPAAIMGKQVILAEGGYHKITGVYAQSLRDAPNVTLVDTNSI